MPLNLQTKLLRFLQERKIRRVGGSTDIKIDVKIISSVSNDPQRAMQEGQIRMDLFYRLAVVFIPIPPLRELKKGVENLTRHFIYKYNIVLGKNVIGVSENVIDIFRRYAWPGNVRELEHLIEGTLNVIEAEDIIRMQHLPRHFLTPELTILTEEANSVEAVAEFLPDSSGVKGAESEINTPDFAGEPNGLLRLQKIQEREMINTVLVESAGNVSQAARRLNVSRQLLHYKMKKYGLKRQDYNSLHKPPRLAG